MEWGLNSIGARIGKDGRGGRVIVCAVCEESNPVAKVACVRCGTMLWLDVPERIALHNKQLLEAIGHSERERIVKLREVIREIVELGIVNRSYRQGGDGCAVKIGGRNDKREQEAQEAIKNIHWNVVSKEELENHRKSEVPSFHHCPCCYERIEEEKVFVSGHGLRVMEVMSKGREEEMNEEMKRIYREWERSGEKLPDVVRRVQRRMRDGE